MGQLRSENIKLKKELEMVKKKEERFDAPLDEKTIVSIGSIAENLIRAADRIHRYRIAIALGQEMPEGFEKGNKDFQNEILQQVNPLIRDYQQEKAINAATSADVVNLLAKGKITPNEAIALLSVLKSKMQVEENELLLEVKKQLLEEIEEGEEEEEEEEEEGAASAKNK